MFERSQITQKADVRASIGADILKETINILKKDHGVDWKNLKNREKVAVIDAMKLFVYSLKTSSVWISQNPCRTKKDRDKSLGESRLQSNEGKWS